MLIFIAWTQQLEEVEKFTYMGSVISQNSDTEVDVKCRIGKAAAVFRRMNKICYSLSISLKIKLRLFSAIVVPTAIYASETWKASGSINNRLDVFQQRCLRRILKIRFYDHITNEEVLWRSGVCKLHNIVARRRLRLAGHILRMENNRIPKTAMRWVPLGAKRPWGRPRNTWRRTFLQDLKTLNMAWDDAEALAQDRSRWRMIAARYAT